MTGVSRHDAGHMGEESRRGVFGSDAADVALARGTPTSRLGVPTPAFRGPLVDEHCDPSLTRPAEPPSGRREHLHVVDRGQFLPIPESQERDGMNSTRRTVVRTAAAAIAAPIVGAFAQTRAEFTLKYANNSATTHPLNARAREMSELIKVDTRGRVDLQVFPNNQLGSDTEVLGQLRSGGVEFFTLSGLILSTLVPAASITGIGFAFADYASVWKALDGELGSLVRREIAKSGLVVMDKIWDNGFRQMTSSIKPIVTAEDLKGFKIRVPISPLWTSMFRAYGAAPTSINFSDVYSALQTRVVDGQENPLVVISTAKLYEVQKYCSLTNHMWDGFWFLANKRSWERLPADLRAIVARRINETCVKQRTDVATLNASLQKELAEKGMVFNTPNSEGFRKQLRESGFYTDWKGKYGNEAWSILERSTGKLA